MLNLEEEILNFGFNSRRMVRPNGAIGSKPLITLVKHLGEAGPSG